MDEVHFQQHGSRCRMWIPLDIMDPIQLHHPTRKGVGYFGAVRVRDGKLFYMRETDRFNAETCFSFLRRLWAISLCSNRKVVVITDNARYHHARLHKKWRKAAEPWFRLEFLPPYSPDLNPIERIWKLTRRLATHNRYFPTMDILIGAIENTFNNWRKGNDTLRRLCAIT